MSIVTFEPRITSSLPGNWTLYMEGARKDGGQAARPHNGKRFYSKEQLGSILCDASFALIDTHDKPLPGAEDLLRSFRSEGGFGRVVVCSSGIREVRNARDLFGALADDYLHADGLLGSRHSSKTSLAKQRDIGFVLEDNNNKVIYKGDYNA